ncbi:MAG: glycosyltransferase, partial [Chitinophagaceae bacterium]
NSKLVIHNHCTASTLNQLIAGSTVIISRSGYSTVMDLIGTGKKCLFIPTPGQPEQEYLAKYLAAQNLCVSFHQDRFHLQDALARLNQEEFKSFQGALPETYRDIIEDFVNHL